LLWSSLLIILLLLSCWLSILLGWSLIVILNFWTFISINRKVVSCVSGWCWFFLLGRFNKRSFSGSFSKWSFPLCMWWIFGLNIAPSESVWLRGWRSYWLLHWWFWLFLLLSNWCWLWLSYWGLTWKILLSLKWWLSLSLCCLWWWKWLTCFSWLNSGCFISSVIVYTSWLFAAARSVVEASGSLDEAV